MTTGEKYAEGQGQTFTLPEVDAGRRNFKVTTAMLSKKLEQQAIERARDSDRDGGWREKALEWSMLSLMVYNQPIRVLTKGHTYEEDILVHLHCPNRNSDSA